MVVQTDSPAEKNYLDPSQCTLPLPPCRGEPAQVAMPEGISAIMSLLPRCATTVQLRVLRSIVCIDVRSVSVVVLTGRQGSDLVVSDCV